MLDSFSERLNICRTVTKLGATHIVNQLKEQGIQFSTRQLARWEKEDIDSKRILKSEVIEAIVDLFNQNGLPELSVEWLLSGAGIPPFTVDMSGALDEEKAFYIARAMGDGYTLSTISSNYSEPFVSTGDQIITRESAPEKLENKIAFVKTKDHKLFLGILTNLESQVKIDNIDRYEIIDKSNIAYCGKLTWIS